MHGSRPVGRPPQGAAPREFTLWNDECGASLLEYSLLIGISAAAVVAMLAVGGWIASLWSAFAAALGVG